MRTAHFVALAALVLAQRTSAQMLPANELGRIPVLEYHKIGDTDSRWGRSRDGLKRDLELLYARGYRPITVAQLVDGKIDIPAGRSPVVFTFDDASPGQFRYLEKDGKLEIDPTSGVGIWLAFSKAHPDWGNRATFCMLPSAMAGHAFFGDKEIEGQRTEWRYPKLRFLAAQGFELCDHTLWHAQLNKYPDAVVQEQIARGVMAIDSAVPGYKVRTFAVPQGLWPKNRALAREGRYAVPHSERVVRYRFDAVLDVTGTTSRSPRDPSFDAGRIPRIQVIGDNLKGVLDRLEATRYVAGRAPGIARR
ncbi:MAG: polysaccharide deacetylase family protein [Gemmatimonadaceae bacterium]